MKACSQYHEFDPTFWRQLQPNNDFQFKMFEILLNANRIILCKYDLIL